MTTPNQSAPDYGLTWDGLSYEIGGGLYNYGQGLDDPTIKWLIYGPKATLENIWELMEFHLSKMPLDVLKIWEPFIPGKFLDPDFVDVPTAVATIIEFFSFLPKLLSVDEWLAWLEEVFGPFFTDTVKFVEDALKWLEETFAPLVEFVDQIAADIAKAIEDVAAALEEVWTSVDELFGITDTLQTLYDQLVRLVDEATRLSQEAFGKATEAITDAANAMSEALAASGAAEAAAAAAEAARKFAGDGFDALMQGFHGWQGSGYSPAQLRDMGLDLGTALGVLNTVALRVTALEQQVQQILEDFASYVNNLTSLPAALWTQYYQGSGSGTLGVNNGYAQFNPKFDTLNKTATAINKTVTDSDFQRVSIVVSKTLADLAASANFIFARTDPTTANGDRVFARLYDTTAQIGFVKNGATTILGTVANVMKNGSTYTLQAGVGNAANTFQLFENTRPLFANGGVVDTAGTSSMGPAYRGTGFGTFAPNATARPGVVASFAAQGA